jgi:heme oxygenase
MQWPAPAVIRIMAIATFFMDISMNVPATHLAEASRCKRLKAASSRDHDRVDELVMAARPFEDRERYARFLQVQYSFHGSLVALYGDEHLNQRLPGLVHLSRFAAVEADLGDLGLALPAAPQQVVASPAEALGWLYCSEGSNLGAAFLFKQTQRLGLDGDQGARHLAPHPDGRALHWREFVASIDGLALAEEEEAEVIAGAIAAFDSYRAHLREVFAGS